MGTLDLTSTGKRAASESLAAPCWRRGRRVAPVVGSCGQHSDGARPMTCGDQRVAQFRRALTDLARRTAQLRREIFQTLEDTCISLAFMDNRIWFANCHWNSVRRLRESKTSPVTSA